MTAPFGSYEYWHQQRNNRNAAKNAVPVLKIAATSEDYPTGIMDKQGPLVKLLAVENARAQAAQSGNPALQLFAAQTPHWYAYEGALDDPQWIFSEAERFVVMTNCAASETTFAYSGGGMQCTDNTPSADGKAWNEGPAIPDSAQLPTHIDTPEEVAALVAQWVKRSALQL